MNERPAPVKGKLAEAMRELALVREQTTAERAKLVRMQREAASGDAPAGSLLLSDLVLANEQLVLTSLRDRSHAETAEAALRRVQRVAETDALTQLPNRSALLERLDHAIAHARRDGERLAVLFLDLDDFKQINDSLGHGVGDEVLRLTARRLMLAVRDIDLVSRHGGDEFVIVLPGLTQVADALSVADKLIAALAAPHMVHEHVLCLKASVGISIYPDDGEDADTLLNHADAAMYCAKRKGLGSFVLHREAAGAVAGVIAANARAYVPSRQDLITGEFERRHADLREANQQLVLAALDARQLQAAAELAHHRQKELLAVVAHELRNPLTPMRMAAGLLGEVRAEVLPQLKQIIEREVHHLSRLIGDLLDVSRVHSGKLRLERRRIDLRAIVDEAIDACRFSMDERSQHFQLHATDAAIPMHADGVRLAQVVRNLLDNASKYTPHGGRIDLSLRRLKRRVVLTVADTGIGMRAETLAHVFDPFVQDPHAVGFNGAGLGIGLTVVRELVEAHGGKVVARSAGSGHGSQFIVTLPCTPKPATPEAGA